MHNIFESKIDVENTIYFHGSKNSGMLKQIQPPTPSNPFFVTKDIDYAFEYAKKNKDGVKNIYVVSFDGEKLNVFIPKKDYEQLKGLWPQKIIDEMIFRKNGRRINDILNIFRDYVSYFMMFTQDGFDIDEKIKQLRASKFFNDNSQVDETLDAWNVFQFFVNRKDIDFYNDFKKEDELGKPMITWMRTLFCKDLLKLGFNAYVSQEMLNGYSSDECYCIFSKEAFKTFGLIPIKQDVAEKAFDRLGSVKYDYQSIKNYDESNDIIREFMKVYKKVENE